jgi:group I intron endonuclease
MNHNHLDNLPKIIVFNNLHVSEGRLRRAVIKALTGIAGIYAIINTVTGCLYIGSSVSVGIRLTSHLISRNTNGHLQSAIALIGLEVFQVVLVEIYELDPNLSDVENSLALLEREQPWLDWLFSLPEQFRYNFASVAEASFKGLTHTPETKALISASMTGKSHSDETRAKISEAHKGLQSGENNPMYGRICPR